MLAGMMARPRADFDAHELGRQSLAERDEFHFGGDVAAPRVGQLRRRRTVRRAAHGDATAFGYGVGVAPGLDPSLAKRGQALFES